MPLSLGFLISFSRFLLTVLLGRSLSLNLAISWNRLSLSQDLFLRNETHFRSPVLISAPVLPKETHEFGEFWQSPCPFLQLCPASHSHCNTYWHCYSPAQLPPTPAGHWAIPLGHWGGCSVSCSRAPLRSMSRDQKVFLTQFPHIGFPSWCVQKATLQ